MNDQRYAACEPRHTHREEPGYHWLSRLGKKPVLVEWSGATGTLEGFWRSPVIMFPVSAHSDGWRYLEPVTPLAVVEALRREVTLLRGVMGKDAQETTLAGPNNVKFLERERELRATLDRLKGGSRR